MTLLEHIELRGVQVNISEETINRFLYSLDYMAPQDNLYAERHQQLTEEEKMFDLTSRVIALTWIENE